MFKFPCRLLSQNPYARKTNGKMEKGIGEELDWVIHYVGHGETSPAYSGCSSKETLGESNT